MLPTVELYVLEVAALLHDIGKIGVPDAILRKPESLTPHEWRVMSRHDRIGAEIVCTIFSDQSLLEIIENHHAFYGGEGRHENLPTGTDIPLLARLLSIADAYDAMVSDRVYREKMSQEEAFLELQRNAGTQFDPELVQRIIRVVSDKVENVKTEQCLVSRDAVIQLNEQMERLVRLIDQLDYDGLGVLAAQLQETAIQERGLEVVDLTCQLQNAARVVDLVEATYLTNRLRDLRQIGIGEEPEFQSV